MPRGHGAGEPAAAAGDRIFSNAALGRHGEIDESRRSNRREGLADAAFVALCSRIRAGRIYVEYGSTLYTVPSPWTMVTVP